MSLFFRLFKRAKKFSVDLMFWSVEPREINSTPQSSYLCFSRSNDVLFDRSVTFSGWLKGWAGNNSNGFFSHYNRLVGASNLFAKMPRYSGDDTSQATSSFAQSPPRMLALR
jgi:hypothetical protein